MPKTKTPLGRIMRLDVALIIAALVGAVLLGALRADEGSSAYDEISADLEPLRSAFNANPNHVRAILLASPT